MHAFSGTPPEPIFFVLLASPNTRLNESLPPFIRKVGGSVALGESPADLDRGPARHEPDVVLVHHHPPQVDARSWLQPREGERLKSPVMVINGWVDEFLDQTTAGSEACPGSDDCSLTSFLNALRSVVHTILGGEDPMDEFASLEDSADGPILKKEPARLKVLPPILPAGEFGARPGSGDGSELRPGPFPADAGATAAEEPARRRPRGRPKTLRHLRPVLSNATGSRDHETGLAGPAGAPRTGESDLIPFLKGLPLFDHLADDSPISTTALHLLASQLNEFRRNHPRDCGQESRCGCRRDRPCEFVAEGT